MSEPITAQSFASAVQPVAADTVIITDAQGLTTGMVSVPTADGKIPAYRAVPEGAGRYPVVLVVQEIFGVHEYIKDVARRLAKLGYLAIAPELYQRQGDVSKLPTIEAIREVVMRVPDAQVLSDLDACATWAAQHGGDDRLALTGFCWGGRIAWLYAAHRPTLKAAVAWYGRLVGDTTALHRYPVDIAGDLEAPVLGLYGGQDFGIPLDTVERMESELAKHHSPSTLHVYPNAPHAFHADYRSSYRKEAAEDGWRRLLEWFRQHGM